VSDAIITVERVSKRYVISHKNGRGGDGLSHALEDFIRAPLQWIRDKRDDSKEEFWALKDVSFEVRRGDVLGIVGRNGAGKSTLLKLLSRITEPTAGRISVKGRVASLLEVGTGFHQELTGRENIFLNGAILGMRRSEIKKRFDEIVSFAEIGKFLDTPVKRYSSGMYVRLAFAVAAHLEPEILIVDEVLAVGDTKFQNKCLGKMQEVSKSEGRTILFVSHNLAALSSLCNRGVLLHGGQKKLDADLTKVIERYHSLEGSVRGAYNARTNAKAVQIMSVSVASASNTGVHVSGERLRIRVTVRCDEPIRHGCLAIQVTNYQGIPVLHLRAYDGGVYFGSAIGDTTFDCDVPECWLNVGPYRLNVFIADPPGGDTYEVLQGVCPFDVEMRHAGNRFGWRSEVCCYVPPEQWSVVRSSRDVSVVN